MNGRCFISSANTASYIGQGDGGIENGDWLWTRAYARSVTFDSETKAREFAARYLPEMYSLGEVWFHAA